MENENVRIEVKYLHNTVTGVLDVFIGYVEIRLNTGEYIYSQFSKVTRLTAEDALEDAEDIKADLLVS